MLYLPPSTTNRFLQVKKTLERLKFDSDVEFFRRYVSIPKTITIKEVAVCIVGNLTIFVDDDNVNSDVIIILARKVFYFGYTRFVVRTSGKLLFTYENGEIENHKWGNWFANITPIYPEFLGVDTALMGRAVAIHEKIEMNCEILRFQRALGRNIKPSSGIHPLFSTHYVRHHLHDIYEDAIGKHIREDTEGDGQGD